MANTSKTDAEISCLAHPMTIEDSGSRIQDFFSGFLRILAVNDAHISALIADFGS